MSNNLNPNNGHFNAAILNAAIEYTADGERVLSEKAFARAARLAALSAHTVYVCWSRLSVTVVIYVEPDEEFPGVPNDDEHTERYHRWIASLLEPREGTEVITRVMTDPEAWDFTPATAEAVARGFLTSHQCDDPARCYCEAGMPEWDIDGLKGSYIGAVLFDGLTPMSLGMASAEVA